MGRKGDLMDFGLSDEQEMIVSTVRSFVEKEIYPHEAEVERTGEVPPGLGEELKRKVIELGFYACNFPEEVGGAGLSHLDFTLVERELGRGSMALTHFFGRPQNILMACEGDGVRDRVSGAFSSHFFQQHGARISARADQTGRPMAFLGVRLQPNRSGGGVDGTSQARVLRQAAILVNRVTRAEDFLSRLTSNLFVIALPSTLAEDADRIGRRIEGVIANTMFRGKSDDHLFAVDAEVVATARSPGSCIEESVASLLGSMNADKPRSANI